MSNNQFTIHGQNKCVGPLFRIGKEKYKWSLFAAVTSMANYFDMQIIFGML